MLGPKMVHSYNSGFTGHGRNWARPLLIGSLNIQDMIRILKQSRNDASQVNIYVMGIV